MSTFVTTSSYGSNRSDRDRKSSNSMAKSCYLHKKPHDLDTCSEFSRKTVEGISKDQRQSRPKQRLWVLGSRTLIIKVQSEEYL